MSSHALRILAEVHQKPGSAYDTTDYRISTKPLYTIQRYSNGWNATHTASKRDPLRERVMNTEQEEAQ